ncbi:MAG: cytochrome c [Bradyrhizobiaceae bacterium]|nr:cytochrome c [Bradyrhizobiaceae bacterium]
MQIKSRVEFRRLHRVGPAALAGAGLMLGLLGQDGAVAASAEKGKVAFVQHGCWQCHGYQGQGGVTGPKLAPDPIPFDALSTFVRTTNRNMPPFREAILSNEDLADIYAYLESIPKGPPAANIPLLHE